jgi:hypothetical protein
MDELLIDDKKYLSTKRAAKVTGYAKDYVGQLCREGRVPARLVGRSWYVLESALHDHRFGAPQPTVAPAAVSAPEHLQSDPDVLPPTWSSARYEPDTAPEMPQLSKNEPQSEPTVAEESPGEAASTLQDAWREWFTQREQPAVEAQDTATEPYEATQPAETVTMEPVTGGELTEDEAVSVPIHAIYAELPTVDRVRNREPIAAPAVARAAAGDREVQRRPRASGLSRASVVYTAALIALASVVLVVFASGYLDSFAYSSYPAQLIAGIGIVSK